MLITFFTNCLFCLPNPKPPKIVSLQCYYIWISCEKQQILLLLFYAVAHFRSQQHQQLLGIFSDKLMKWLTDYQRFCWFIFCKQTKFNRVTVSALLSQHCQHSFCDFTVLAVWQATILLSQMLTSNDTDKPASMSTRICVKRDSH